MKNKNLIPVNTLKNIKIDTETFKEIEDKITNFEIQFKDVTINSDVEYVAVGGFLKILKDYKRELEAREKELTSPIKLALDYIRNDIFKPFLQRLETIEIKMKQEISIYDEFRKKEDEEKTKKLEEALKQSNPDIAENISIITQSTTPKVEGVKISYRYDFEIVDENLIPREFLKVDEVKIRKVINALKEETKIPGIKIIKKKIIGA